MPPTLTLPLEGGRDGWGCRLTINVIVLVILELHLIEPLIRASARQEIVMAAYFDHTTSGQDDNPVGSLDRGEPMGNHEGGPVFHEIGQGHLDHALRFRIQ